MLNQIEYIEYLSIMVTGRCNMTCEHCLRCDPVPDDILEIFDPVVSKTDNGIDIEDETISLDMYGNLHAGCDFSWDDKSHVITNILSDPAWIQTIYNKFTESSL